MNKQFPLTGLLSFLLILNVPLCFAQDEEPVAPAGQEVEVNEDNYRQFMELKDARGQRNMLPENAFKPDSGTQKLDKLPEESQKHLRNQLREIIVQGDQWQPGDENSQYPYVPSNAAGSDPSLQKQEAEAWGELVENYHQREAEIYENSARSQAAMAAAGASQGTPSGQGNSGQGDSGQGGEGQEHNQPTQGEQGGAADSYSPNAQNDPNATSSQGVSQNAMEFLSGKGEAQAQQGEQQQDPAPSGSSQNALEYLTGGQNQDSQTDGNSPGTEPLPANMKDTLTIQDLLNAQGVRNTTGTGSPAPGVISGPIPAKDDPD